MGRVNWVGLKARFIAPGRQHSTANRTDEFEWRLIGESTRFGFRRCVSGLWPFARCGAVCPWAVGPGWYEAGLWHSALDGARTEILARPSSERVGLRSRPIERVVAHGAGPESQQNLSRLIGTSSFQFLVGGLEHKICGETTKAPLDRPHQIKNLCPSA